MRDDRRFAEATEELSRRLEDWRSRYRPPTPLPVDLWERATDLAAQYGIGPTARALRLDYGALKKRVQAAEAKPSPGAGPTFVELLAPLSGTIAECALEVESSRVGRLRVEMKNVAPSGLASIVRELVG